MKAFHCEKEIKADPDQVWRTLMDIERYPEWNPFMRDCAGCLNDGEVVQVTLDFRDHSPVVEQLEVTHDEEDKELRLKRDGSMLSYEHVIGLVEGRTGWTVLVQSGTFLGLVSPFAGGIVERHAAGAEAMAEALRDVIERDVIEKEYALHAEALS